MLEFRDNLEYTPPRTEHSQFISYIQHVFKLYDKHARTGTSDADCLFKLQRINREYEGKVDQNDRYLFQTAAEFEDFLTQIVGIDVTNAIKKDTEDQAAKAQESGQDFFYGIWLSYTTRYKQRESVNEPETIEINKQPVVMPFLYIPLHVDGHTY